MTEKFRKVISFLGWAWIYVAALWTFGIATALVSKGAIDIFALVCLLTVSLYSLEKNRK